MRTDMAKDSFYKMAMNFIARPQQPIISVPITTMNHVQKGTTTYLRGFYVNGAPTPRTRSNKSLWKKRRSCSWTKGGKREN